MRNRLNHRMAPHRVPSRVLALAVPVLCAGMLSACDDILSLKQSNPGQIEAAGIYQPANASLLMNGVISDFECAYSRVAAGSGILGDEISTAIAQSQNYLWDRRELIPTHPYSAGCGGAQYPGVYTSIARARGSADTTYARVAEWNAADVPNKEQLLARLATYAGYSLAVLGENMCTAAIDAGPELTSAQVFQEALARFDAAIAHANSAGDAVTRNMATLGRARIRLNLGDLPGAATDAGAIPPDLMVRTTPSATDTRLQNMVFMHVNQGFFGTVASSYRDLELDGAPDPRVAVTNTGSNGTAGVAVWTPNKYPTAASPIPVAKYAEAQLIIAEARIAANDFTGAAEAITAARNSGGRTGLPAFDPTGLNADQMRAQLVEERRREFFLEGRRLWDIRRLDLPLDPAPGTPYVPGGGVWGDQRCFLLPDVERNNNPNM